ncbi:MAG TPA: hemolysin family protein, partial [Gemmatimonadales bacterium]|nr:hemolysin family protein [Gemmatimonadales bacterium]
LVAYVLLGAAVLGATAWAALLALADESPHVVRTLGDPPLTSGAPVPVARALQISRLALLALAATAAAVAMRWWEQPAWPGIPTTLFAAALIYLVGDAVPRALGLLMPDLATRALGPARATLAGFRPLLWLITLADRAAHTLFPSRDTKAGVIGTAQRDMLLGVFSLGETSVDEVMTPRLDIVAIEASASWREVVEQLRKSEHARLPVFEDSLDDTVGILHAKDLVPAIAGAVPPPERWQELVRPVQYVPETKTLAAQLRDFQRGPAHLAIVVDEFGGTSGLVTLEDILEEVVGEIRDEYDVDEEPEIEREGDEKFWVDGRVTLDDLSAALGVPIDHPEVSTVGGLVYSELGRVPHPGEELRIAEFRVVVERVVRRRVRRVYFERLEHPEGEEIGAAERGTHS